MKFDDIDKKILDTLQSNARITNAQLAQDAGISPPGMLERVRRLENSGVIKKYVALLNPEKVGRGTLAMVSISLDVHQIPQIEKFTEEINKVEEVLECYHLAGGDDFLLKVAVNDISDYENFMLTKLTKIPGVSKVKTSFILSTVKFDTKLNINSNNHK